MGARVNAVLTFYSNVGEKVRLTIPRADETLTEPQVRTAMEGIIAGGIVITGNGIPTGIHGAELVATTRAPLVSA
ncbi:MAG: DUF2922 domain-containing protein [Defluviitaleaceae bacterium]|nr:DUF2922 domain-containing protein [Defluviitaleaceae bacterium]